MDRSLARELKLNFFMTALRGSVKDFEKFKDAITDFMAFTAESYSDYEKRISDRRKRSRECLIKSGL